MLENALAYCKEKASIPGSSLHYALLFQSIPDQLFWSGCFALSYELREACLKQLQSGLTQVKLGWWQHALADVGQGGAAQHPVIVALGPDTLRTIHTDHWITLIERMADACEVRRFPQLHEWHARTCQDLQPWGALLQARWNTFNASTLNTLIQFWAYSTQLCQLLRLAKYLDEGFQPLPIDWLQRFEIPAEQIKQRQHDEKTHALFTELGAYLIEQAELTWKTLPKPVRLLVRPLRALFRMRQAEWALHAQSSYLLLTEQKGLTPWKKFSISWSTQVLRR